MNLSSRKFGANQRKKREPQFCKFSISSGKSDFAANRWSAAYGRLPGHIEVAVQ
jgi:hypothetical protein